MGSQFDLFLFYISPLEKSFLISKTYIVSCVFFARKCFIVTDGWWMVVVVVDGGWSKKKFFNFAETWDTGSSRYINVHNFRVLVEQLIYGNEIKFQVLKLGKNLQRISTQKNIFMEITCKMNWEKI